MCNNINSGLQCCGQVNFNQHLQKTNKRVLSVDFCLMESFDEEVLLRQVLLRLKHAYYAAF